MRVHINLPVRSFEFEADLISKKSGKFERHREDFLQGREHWWKRTRQPWALDGPSCHDRPTRPNNGPGPATPRDRPQQSTIRTLGTDLHQIVPNILLLTHLPVVLDRHPPGVPMGHSGLVSDILRIASKKVHLNPQHLVGAMHPVADRKLGGLSRKAVSQVHLTKRQQQCLMIFQSISLPLVSSLLIQRKIPPLRAPAL